MTSELNNNPNEKKKKGAGELVEKLIMSFFSLSLIGELLRINKSLKIADELTNNLKGKGGNKNYNPFKTQKNKNLLIILTLISIPLIWTILFSMVLSKRPEMFSYFGTLLDRLSDSISDGFNLKFVLGVDLIEFHRWKTWFLLFLIVLFLEIFMRSKVIKNHLVLHKTRELRTRCITGGFITETGKRPLLWTPSGILIDLEKSNDEDFKKSNEVWLQMSMFPGDVKISQDNRHLIFVYVGQKLRDDYRYFPDGQIEDTI